MAGGGVGEVVGHGPEAEVGVVGDEWHGGWDAAGLEGEGEQARMASRDGSEFFMTNLRGRRRYPRIAPSFPSGENSLGTAASVLPDGRPARAAVTS